MNSSSNRAAVLLLMCVFTACTGSSQELTRAKAKELIETKSVISIVFNTAKEANCLNTTGLVTLRVGNAFGMPLNAEGKIGPTGKDLVEKMTFKNDPFEGVRLVIWFKTPPKIVVDSVTGISSDGNDKRVEYTYHMDWTNVGLTKASGACMGLSPPDPAVSKMRLYDDGWRLVSLN